jgi:hypothetical protein
VVNVLGGKGFSLGGGSLFCAGNAISEHHQQQDNTKYGNVSLMGMESCPHDLWVNKNNGIACPVVCLVNLEMGENVDV